MTRDRMTPNSPPVPTQVPDAPLTALERLVADALVLDPTSSIYEHEEYAEWLLREAHANTTGSERRENERAAQQSATRVLAQLRAQRATASLRRFPLEVREAGIVGSAGDVSDSYSAAAGKGCAPWPESLAVAAGTGRELWDEPCERWVALPHELARQHPRRHYVALTVTGDSMRPVLEPGDVLLVDIAARPAVNGIVVARRPEDGYVVKLVTRLGRGTIELSSFNPEYPPFTLAREANTIVGVVAAVLRRAVRPSENDQRRTKC